MKSSIESGILAIFTGIILISCTNNSPISQNNLNSTLPETINQNIISKLISGKVDYFVDNSFEKTAGKLSTKANLSEVAKNSTISMIDPNNNITIATGITDTNGNFIVNPNFLPELSKIYILEASRRIGGAGNDLMSLRTLIKWGGTKWESLTTSGISINYKTTALAMVANFESSTVTSNSLINQIDTSTNTLVNLKSSVLYSADKNNNGVYLYLKSLNNSTKQILSFYKDSLYPIPNFDMSKITYSVFDSSPSIDIFSSNSDGTNNVNISNTPGFENAESSPIFSPDGNKIAFIKNFNQICVMNSNGTNIRVLDTLSNSDNFQFTSTWSTDNKYFIYGKDGDIFKIDITINNSLPVNLTTDISQFAYDPVCSSDGNKIAFESNSSIYTMNLDGINKTNITSSLVNSVALKPDWSKDSSKISFVSNPLYNVSTIAGGGTSGNQSGNSNGSGISSLFNQPLAITIDNQKNLYVADTKNYKIKKISPDGTVSTVAGGGSSGSQSGSVNGIGINALFTSPTGITIDSNGNNLYIADSDKIRKIAINTGSVSTIYSNNIYPYSLAIDKTGNNIYFVGRSSNDMKKLEISTGLVTIVASNIYASNGFSYNIYHGGILVDNSGNNLYISDYSNNTIKKLVIATGEITIIAGSSLFGVNGTKDGIGSYALFHYPAGLAIDSTDSNLYVTDHFNKKIRKINLATGIVNTIVGGGNLGYEFGTTDSSTRAALFNSPLGIAIDNSNDTLYVTDTGNNKIRKITGVSQNYTNNIYTVNIDGSNLKQLTNLENFSKITNSSTWSEDGNSLLFNEDIIFRDILSVNTNTPNPVTTVDNINLKNITNNAFTEKEYGKPYFIDSSVIPISKFIKITDLVAYCISNNLDPLSYIGYSNGNYSIVNSN